jgi:hypothetical protein
MIELLGLACIGMGVWLAFLLAYLSSKFKDDRYDDM